MKTCCKKSQTKGPKNNTNQHKLHNIDQNLYNHFNTNMKSIKDLSHIICCVWWFVSDNQFFYNSTLHFHLDHPKGTC